MILSIPLAELAMLQSSVQLDPLDNLIYAGGVLFILSIITEKLTQLVRLYPAVFKGIALIFFLLFYVVIVSSYAADAITVAELAIFIIANTIVIVLIAANFSAIENNRSGKVRRAARSLSVLKHVRKNRLSSIAFGARESAKEKDVTLLSFLVGLFITYVFNCSIFELFSDPTKIGMGSNINPLITANGTLQVNAAYFQFSWIRGAGFLLTAFFLSFGSKFFHDLLDNLMQIKNLRKKLNDVTSESGTGALDCSPQRIEQVLVAKTEFLKKLPGYKSSNVGAVRISGEAKYFASLNFSEDLPDEIYESVEKVFKVEGIPIRIFANRRPARARFGKVSNSSDRSYVGSIACGVTDGTGGDSLLTAAHVLLSGNYAPDNINNVPLDDKVKLQYEGVKSIDGIWTFGWQDDTLDIALTTSGRTIPQCSLMPFTPTVSDLGIEVFFKGATTSLGAGFLAAINEPCDVEFENKTVPMVGLLKVTNTDSGDEQSIAAGGDSGSLLFDSNERALGMIIASTDDFTYAIPIATILAKINKTLL